MRWLASRIPTSPFELIPHARSERATQVRSDQLVRRGCSCRPEGLLLKRDLLTHKCASLLVLEINDSQLGAAS